MIAEIRACIAKASQALGELDKKLTSKKASQVATLRLARTLIAINDLAQKLAGLNIKLQAAAGDED